MLWVWLVMGATLMGTLLGKMIAGDRLRVVGPEQQPFASLSANPDAATADPVAQPDCIFCPDSFGVGAKLRDRRTEYGYAYPYAPVELNDSHTGEMNKPAPIDAQEGDYQYGGSFSARAFSSEASASLSPSPRDLLPESHSLGTQPLERPNAQSVPGAREKNNNLLSPPRKSAAPSPLKDQTEPQPGDPSQ